MSASVLVGTQWGDEGKGKVTDLISGDFDVVCRYAGGANAGHTVIAGDTKLALHQVPSLALCMRIPIPSLAMVASLILKFSWARWTCWRHRVFRAMR